MKIHLTIEFDAGTKRRSVTHCAGRPGYGVALRGTAKAGPSAQNRGPAAEDHLIRAETFKEAARIVSGHAPRKS